LGWFGNMIIFLIFLWSIVFLKIISLLAWGGWMDGGPTDKKSWDLKKFFTIRNFSQVKISHKWRFLTRDDFSQVKISHKQRFLTSKDLIHTGRAEFSWWLHNLTIYNVNAVVQCVYLYTQMHLQYMSKLFSGTKQGQSFFKDEGLGGHGKDWL